MPVTSGSRPQACIRCVCIDFGGWLTAGNPLFKPPCNRLQSAGCFELQSASFSSYARVLPPPTFATACLVSASSGLSGLGALEVKMGHVAAAFEALTRVANRLANSKHPCCHATHQAALQAALPGCCCE